MNIKQCTPRRLILCHVYKHMSFPPSSSLHPLVSRTYLCIKIHNCKKPSMTGKEILHKIKAKAACFDTSELETKDGENMMQTSASDPEGQSKLSARKVTHGFHLVEGKAGHAMEDYVVARYKQVDDNELGLFAIFDGHLSREVPDYLCSHLFENILQEPDFWTETEKAITRAYRITDTTILEKANDLGKGGSTAVTAILINGQKLVVANVGDSRAVICKNGMAKQLSVDHEPSKERTSIESRGGFVISFPGDVPRVDGQLAVARAFGDKTLKEHLSSVPDVAMEMIDQETEFFILASDGLWVVMSNEEAVDSIKHIKDPKAAAKHLVNEALARKSKDDISCIVVRFC